MTNSWGRPCAGIVLALSLVVSGAAFADEQQAPPTKKPAPAKAEPAPKPAPVVDTNVQSPFGVPTDERGATVDAHEEAKVEGNEPATPDMLDWSFAGPFGHYDIAQLQRGYQVYKEVCSTCHSMKLVAFRNLTDLGYNEGQIKALAETYQVEDGPNDKGEMYKRPGRLSDYFPSPFPNPEAAAAAYGKAPPDMSTLAKARSWERGFPAFIFDFFTQAEENEGPDHIYAVLNGYTKPDDPKYNIYMTNHKIAMPKPLSDGQVDYTDGSPKTLHQYAKDVSAFLMWAAEPKLEQRKQMGFSVMIFLIVFATLLFFIKKMIWARVHDGEV